MVVAASRELLDGTDVSNWSYVEWEVREPRPPREPRERQAPRHQGRGGGGGKPSSSGGRVDPGEVVIKYKR